MDFWPFYNFLSAHILQVCVLKTKYAQITQNAELCLFVLITLCWVTASQNRSDMRAIDHCKMSSTHCHK